MTTQTPQHELSPELSALEASLAALEPQVESGVRDAAKLAVLARLAQLPSGKQHVTLSLGEYVKSVRLTAGFYGAVVGAVIGVLIGLAFGVFMMSFFAREMPAQAPIREIHHIPYIIGENGVLTPLPFSNQEGDSHVPSQYSR